MPCHIQLEPHLTTHDLEVRYRGCHDLVERSHWHFLWLLARGLTATAVARVTSYSAYWIGQIARRYNRDGPDGMRDRRHTAQAQAHPRVLLPEGKHADLRTELARPHPAGDRWCGRTVAAWIGERLGRRVCRQTGWNYLRRVGARWQKPRPRHVRADPAAQAEFVARLRPLLRQVATAFPRARVEVWAVDEHRIGLKPIIRKVWTLEDQRPLAPVEHRYEWRYLVGFAHPASGRTVFHLATSVSIPLFEVELAKFARVVGAGPQKQIVLVLERAGWHASIHLRVPEHLHLLFLPAYSPELQPAEHLWPLTNTILANRHFTDLDALEEAQAARCVVLQAQPDLIQSATYFPWWPRRIHARQGPRSRGS